MQDEIIAEVERVREEIARRHDFDIDRIFQAAKDRSAERREAEPRCEEGPQKGTPDPA